MKLRARNSRRNLGGAGPGFGRAVSAFTLFAFTSTTIAPSLAWGEPASRESAAMEAPAARESVALDAPAKVDAADVRESATTSTRSSAEHEASAARGALESTPAAASDLGAAGRAVAAAPAAGNPSD